MDVRFITQTESRLVMKISSCVLAVATMLVAVAGTPAVADGVRSGVDRAAIISAKASRSLLIDVARAGNRIVAVGDRGHILWSDNEGKDWTQAKVPVSVMLTAVYFPNEREGWAVGHNGVILFSADSGASWQLQRSDKTADGEKAGAPLLGVWFADNQNGYAVGAYGYFLATHDGGTTWVDNAAALNNGDGWHLNAIRGLQGTDTVFIVGEHGILFRSTDRGATWHSLPSPFDGSFFGIAPVAQDLLLVYGLQGRLFASSNDGASWQQIQTGVTSGLNTAVRTPEGDVIVAGNAGVVLNAKGGLNFIPETRPDRQSITAVLPLSTGGLLTVGDGGVKVLPALGK